MYGSGVASGHNLTDQFISVNQYGYDIDKITVTGLNVPLSSGATYWLNLQNATVPSGDPVFWDENDGVGCTGDDGHGGGCPSEASERSDRFDWCGIVRHQRNQRRNDARARQLPAVWIGSSGGGRLVAT